MTCWLSCWKIIQTAINPVQDTHKMCSTDESSRIKTNKNYETFHDPTTSMYLKSYADADAHAGQ